MDEVFKTADKMDSVAFSAFLAEDVKFRFSNNDVWTGRQSVVDGLNYLFSKIDGLRHEIKGVYKAGESYAIESIANYTMKDGKVISLPAVSVLKYMGELIGDYRIYMDISPVKTYGERKS